MTKYCPECSGKVRFIPPNLVCLACGLSLTLSEFEQIYATRQREKFERELSMNENPKEKRHREYLEWFEGQQK